MRLQTWRGSGEVNGGQQRSTEVNTNQQQESTQVLQARLTLLRLSIDRCKLL